MKKVIIGIIIAIIILALGAGAYFILNSANQKDEDNANQELLASNNERNVVKKEENTTNNAENEILNNKETENTQNTSTGGKTLVVYYSAQSHTKAVSEKIADKLNADMFEIIPEDVYTSDDLDWTDSNSRVFKEHDDESLRDIKLEKDTVDNWDEYDKVLIGYPIWWGIAAWPVDTFVKANDFNGKRVIPFCTSASSGLGQSGKLLEREANGGDWEEGHRFRSNPTDAEINDWIEHIK